MKGTAFGVNTKDFLKAVLVKDPAKRLTAE